MLNRADVAYTDPLPDNVRFVEPGDHTWLANFSDRIVNVDGPAEATWIVSDDTVDSYDVAVIDEDVVVFDVSVE